MAMTRVVRPLVSLLTVLVVLFGLIVAIGVWPPDLFSSDVRTLATAQKDGHRFRLVQYWGSDFYTTELLHTYPDGTRSTYLIDGDDHKHWSAGLCIAAKGHSTVVSFADERSVVVEWQRDGANSHFLPQPYTALPVP